MDMKHGGSGQFSETYRKGESMINKKRKLHLNRTNRQCGGTQTTGNAKFPDKNPHASMAAVNEELSLYTELTMGDKDEKMLKLFFTISVLGNNKK